MKVRFAKDVSYFRRPRHPAAWAASVNRCASSPIAHQRLFEGIITPTGLLISDRSARDLLKPSTSAGTPKRLVCL